jgi:hypothetical protein
LISVALEYFEAPSNIPRNVTVGHKRPS